MANSGQFMLISYTGTGPSALTRVEKRIYDEEIVVSVVWRLTHYFNNVREGMDDAKMRETFSEVR
jgi:hypothetical protein